MPVRLARTLSRLSVASRLAPPVGPPPMRPLPTSLRQISTTSSHLRTIQIRPRQPITKFQTIPRRNAQTKAKGSFRTSKGELKLMYLFRQQPIVMSVVFFSFAVAVVGVVYINYYYQTYIIGAFKAYPEPVAVELRKALYFTNRKVDPQRAMKYYRRALEKADELGMDPFSDEIIGVKTQIADFMKKIGHWEKAVGVLEILKSDCLKWMDQLSSKPENVGKRTRIMHKLVQVSVSLATLYSDPHIQQPEKAEAEMIWAVETALREQKRRNDVGVKEGEGEFMSPNELGATLEALAHNYEEKGTHYLAAPLFLQALALAPPGNCHNVILMNNLATSLAQQLPVVKTGLPQVSRKEYVSNARQWANKALSLASSIVPPVRTEECDIGCAVATHNLGEFAEMDGSIAEARKRYTEAKALAKGIGFSEGVQQADEALKRIQAK